MMNYAKATTDQADSSLMKGNREKCLIQEAI
jgi:hypothetical protein